MLDSPEDSLLPRLKPDPFLPSRIRAIVDGKTGRQANARAIAALTRQGFRGWIMASCASVAVAVTLGIFIGKGLAPQSHETTVAGDNTTSLAEEYYDAISPASVFDIGEETIDPEA